MISWLTMGCLTCHKRHAFIGGPHFRFTPPQATPELRTMGAPPPRASGFRRETVVSIPRAVLRVAALVLVVAMGSGLSWAAPSPQLVDQTGSQLAVYGNVKSYVDRSPADLVAQIPALKGLSPVANKQQGKKVLGTILDRVEQNVRQFYSKFPDTTSNEHITLERLKPDGKVGARRDETFRYIAIARDTKGVSTLVEYRTDMAGNPVQPTGLEQGFLITRGFASLAILFHPALRADAFFRYLGKQELDGIDTDVVAFAQRPGWTESPMHVRFKGRTVSVLVQGLAWIDPANYQILHMRTDLLAPRPEIGLMGDTTETTYAEVRFHGIAANAMWLPRVVTVTIKWVGEVENRTIMYLPGTVFQTTVTNARRAQVTYHNIHRYSNYKVFASKSKLKY